MSRTDDIEQHVSRRREVLDQLRTILVEALNVQREPTEIDPDTPLFGTGLRLDSIDAVELWVQLDLAFGIQPGDDAASRLGASRTLNTLVDLVLSQAPRPSRGPLDQQSAASLASSPNVCASRGQRCPRGNDAVRDMQTLAIRQGAGLARMTHVACLRVGGRDCYELLDAVCPVELFLRDGQMLHTLLLDLDAHPVADLYVCRDDEDFILLAEGIGAQQLERYLRDAGPSGIDADYVDLGQRFQLLSLSGPYAWEVLAEVVGAEVIGLPYLTFFHHDGWTCFRSGKTGEYGYDLLVPEPEAEDAWTRLSDAGRPFELMQVELEALDQCALENGFFSIRREGRGDLTPLELQLQWRVSYHKDYVGAAALDKRRRSLAQVRRTCTMISDAPLARGDELQLDGETIGRLLDAGYSATRGDWVGLGLVPREVAHPGISLVACGDAKQARTLTVSAPTLNNRSLFVDPRKHSFGDRSVGFPSIARRYRYDHSHHDESNESRR